MMARRALSERLLLVLGAAAVTAWCLILLAVALSFAGTSTGATWAVRVFLLLVGATGTVGLVRQARLSWTRAVSRPLPGGWGSRWLASQPAWRLAVGCWVLYAAPEAAIRLWMSYRGHHEVITPPHVAYLACSILGACLTALLCSVLWRRQSLNSSR